MVSCHDAQLQNRFELHARADMAGRNAENLAETTVDDLQATIIVIQTQTLRHVVESGIESSVGLVKLLFLPL